MNEEKRMLTEKERLLIAFQKLPEEWRKFALNFLRIATEQESHDPKDILDNMLERGIVAKEMYDNALGILESYKADNH